MKYESLSPLQKKMLMRGETAEHQAERALKCSVCGSHLKFAYTTDYVHLRITEQPQCSACRVTYISQTFGLQ